MTLRLYSILEPSAVSTVQFDGGAGGGGAWKRTHRQFASDKRLARSVASSVACQLVEPFKVPGYPQVPWYLDTWALGFILKGYPEVYTGSL